MKIFTIYFEKPTEMDVCINHTFICEVIGTNYFITKDEGKYKLGAIVHKSHTTIYSWCKGICEPDCKSIILLAKALDVSVEQIVKVFAKEGD